MTDEEMVSDWRGKLRRAARIGDRHLAFLSPAIWRARRTGSTPCWSATWRNTAGWAWNRNAAGISTHLSKSI